MFHEAKFWEVLLPSSDNDIGYWYALAVGVSLGVTYHSLKFTRSSLNVEKQSSASSKKRSCHSFTTSK